ncbi:MULTISPECIES: phosphatidate cytidylyltransferase [unclassified Nodularia (in: cyanobacteria)]|uniref:diacylglycerol/polyprenol kinase family protein n=1 Tax=unclassified Nodularia (in: cyanobacteria) TaxID=2656917 RepID=UPI0018820F0B|nr:MULTISPECIES: phosphatidate cytidylyltransferase [unclassified Nodularia (in: cyanobacteria)]MBE9199012.1 phosphatidate cytidylyltransferase [Nodularia sp. LEGE 06071]MCC2696002.1 phosphatidate cytidylyltransferase [Nodularia sp. LEGE 04288]
MNNSDLIGLAASYTYAIGLLVLGEALRRLFGVKPDITRKVIHIGAGMWVFGVMLLFQHWEIGILPFATFIGVNYLLYRYRVIGAMDTQDSSPGTIYFATSVTLLFGLLWRPNTPVDSSSIAVAGVMTMTWGDALAALIGRRFGQHKYQVGNSVRSWEGSAAMLVVSTTVIFFVLLLLPGSSLSPLAVTIGKEQAFLVALVSAVFATLAEAVSPHGTDNLSVPLVASGTIWVLLQSL